MLASGGNAIDAALAANLVLARRHAVHVRRRRRSPRDGLGRRRAGVPRRRAARRRARRSTRCASSRARRRCRRSVRTRARCPARSTVGSRCSNGGGRARSARSARPRGATPSDGFPLTRRGAWFFFAATRWRSSTSGCTTSPTRTARRPPGRGCASPRSRARCSVLADDGPDAYYRGPIGAAIAERLQHAGGFMTADDVAAHEGAWVEPLRARRARHRDPRDAAADAGHRRAGGAAHRRRARPRRRRSRPRAPADRGDEARARRPRRVPRRSRRDDRSTCETMLADEWIADRRARIDPARAQTLRAAAHARAAAPST